MSHPTILVIEDNATTRKMFRLALQSENYTVLEAEDGATALYQAMNHPVNLILQDLILPDMDSLTLNNQLRALPNGDKIPILALSGFLSKMDELQAAGANFNAYLIKPVEISYLIETIQLYLPSVRWINKEKNAVKHILLADDNSIQLKLVRMQLINAGFEVTTATDGKSALDCVEKNLFDAVISDVLMPHLDGFELCLEIRRNPKTAHIPVILISSNYLEEADRALAKKVSADAYLTRTPDSQDLVSTLNSCFKNKKEIKKTESIDAFKEEHIQRLVRQLEHQIENNMNLSNRCALQAAQLSLLDGISAALTNKEGIDVALKDVLAVCLDSAGVSKGILYFADSEGKLKPQHVLGYSKTDKEQLNTFFGQPNLLTEVFSKKEILRFPSSDVPENINNLLLKDADFKTALLIPLIADTQCLGLLFLGSKMTDVTGIDPLSFARTLGAQIGHAIALANAFHQIAASEQRYKTLMDNASCGIYILNSEGVFLEVNKQGEKLLECPKEFMLGKHFHEFMFEADLKYAHAAFQEALEKGFVEMRETRVKTFEGKILTHQYSIVRIAVDNKLLIMVVVNDVTERNQLRTQALLNDKLAMVGTLSAGIAHEINNPIAWILANLNFIKAQVNTLYEDAVPAQKKEMSKFESIINESIDGAARISSIVHDLKGFARVNEVEIKPINLHDTLNAVINMASPSFKFRAKIEKNFTDSLPKLMVSSGKSHQVFLNLIMNAAQAIPENNLENNKISITTQREGDFIRVDICDTGSGIAPENLPRIFEPFFTTKKVGQGTGLGLSICHDIIYKLGGKIMVKSVVGKGSTFSVYFPMQLATQEKKKQEVKKNILNIKRKRILIIDDEENLLKSFKRLLEDKHDVTIATSGASAMQLLAKNENEFDVLLVDIMMPEMSGADVYRKIGEKYPALLKSIIFMSGGAYTPELKNFLETVKNPHLDKPFQKEELDAAIAKL